MTPRQNLSGFAVDIGGTKCTMARIEGGAVLEQCVQATDTSFNLEAHIESISTGLQCLGFRPSAMVGVAVCGRLTTAGEWSAINSKTLPTIAGAPLLAALRRRFARVSCCNDAIAAALAEAYYGADHMCQRLLYLTISTGVGAGIVLNGQPLCSPNGLAGHAGFMSSRWASERCGSGRMATVESIASGKAIAQAAARAGYADLDAHAVFAAAQNGAAWAEKLIQASASAIATLCADLQALLAFDKVVLGGGVGSAEGYCQRVQQSLLYEPPLFRPPVCVVELATAGPLLGALAWTAKQLRQEVKDRV